MNLGTLDLQKRLLPKCLVFPTGLLVLGVVPGINFLLFSGHSGLGWLIAWVSPLGAIIGFAIDVIKDRRSFWLDLLILLMFVALSYPLAGWVERDVKAITGLPLERGVIWKVINWPFVFWLPSSH